MEPIEEISEEAMRKFLRRHGKMTLLMIAWIAVSTIVTIFVFFKVAADAQVLGLVPAVLGQWSVGIFFIFILQVIFWELVFVASWGIPIIIAVFLWFKRLPEEERKEYGLSPKRGADPRRTEGGGFFSFLVGVVWLIIVWVTGRWTLPLQAWTFNDWIYTFLAAGLWVLVPVVIGGTIYLIWFMLKEPKTES